MSEDYLPKVAHTIVDVLMLSLTYPKVRYI